MTAYKVTSKTPLGSHLEGLEGVVWLQVGPNAISVPDALRYGWIEPVEPEITSSEQKLPFFRKIFRRCKNK